MANKTVSELKREIQKKELELWELEEEYRTALYLSKMPEVDPLYKYCYATANFSMRHENESVVCWLRAVAKHMSDRRPGHGGAYNNVMIIQIPEKMTEKSINKWAEYQRDKLCKAALKHKKRK